MHSPPAHPHSPAHACTALPHTHTRARSPDTHVHAGPWRRPFHARAACTRIQPFPCSPLLPTHPPDTHSPPTHTRPCRHTRCTPPHGHTRASLLIPTPKIHPPDLTHTSCSHRTFLSLTHTLTCSSHIFPLAQAPSNPRHAFPCISPHRTLSVSPQNAACSHLQGWVSQRCQGSHLVLPSVVTAGGSVAGRGARALPHPWGGPTGLKEKNIGIIIPTTAQGGQLPCSGQNFPQNQPLVHFPSPLLGAKGRKDVSEAFSYM